MKRTETTYVVPLHCTGWKAINRFAEEMTDLFILNMVGMTIVFTG